MNKQRNPDYPFPQWNPDHLSFVVLKEWRESLEDDKGGRADLRRAGSLIEVMLVPAFHRFLRKLRASGFGISESRYPKLAAIAGLAAMVKEESGGGLATSMGTPKNPNSEKPTVSELRMRRILACDDIEELFGLLRRGLALLDETANVVNLAAIIWHWVPMDEKRSNDPRRQMAYDYYAAAPL
jgi:CRISPR system Cascade subunit CasB